LFEKIKRLHATAALPFSVETSNPVSVRSWS